MTDDYSLTDEVRFLLWKLECFQLEDWAWNAAFERLDQVLREIDSTLMRLCSKITDLQQELDGAIELERIPLPRDSHRDPGDDTAEV
jgi:hypothetical protein